MKTLSYILIATGLLASSTLAAPYSLGSQIWKRADATPAISKDFPDPSIMQDADGTWYAFATSGNNKKVQVAKAAAASGPWTYIDKDVLPNAGPWTTSKNTWAPDVRRMSNGSYVMYFSGEVANNTAHHCVGTATATSVLGPYTPSQVPFNCNLTIGGSIDPSGFQDADGKRYVAYKIDGNSVGHGGTCNNGVAPFVSTPIMLQQVGTDGITKIGAAVQILDRTTADGPLVEAPTILRKSASMYVLFFSSGCYTESTYNVDYATATSVLGPYTRSAGGPLISTDDSFGLTAPGGATPAADGSGIVFHANCNAGRCLFESTIGVMGSEVILNGVNGIGM